MDAQWLLTENPVLRTVAVLLIALPTLFVLVSRRASLWTKPWWALATQLAWGFALLYTWVWQQRYADSAAPQMLGGLVLEDAIGWWTYAFPWAVYLLFRATRAWFPGEKRGA
jgi:hypothetical protein